ncbi:MAG: hypothetical protein KJ600_05795 [Nanoarchaeota archaeon]|nr:hypothetical protein [Nanoarchaeota archaeon]MBU1104042.1 hypothetical protein [Nanoarchaeota archaeon]
MVTTIQLNEDVKKSLERMKQVRETYEDVIARIISQLNEQKRKHEELMIEGCKEMAEESLKITKEFEQADAEIDWEWTED